MKHDKNSQVIAVLAKWCKEHENTMETSYDMAKRPEQWSKPSM
jgi:hypothetical protein